MLNSLNILAGKISPQNHDENGVVVVVSGSDHHLNHHSPSSRFVSVVMLDEWASHYFIAITSLGSQLMASFLINDNEKPRGFRSCKDRIPKFLIMRKFLLVSENWFYQICGKWIIR